MTEAELRQLARDVFVAIELHGGDFEHWYYGPDPERFSPTWQSVWERVAHEYAAPAREDAPATRRRDR